VKGRTCTIDERGLQAQERLNGDFCAGTGAEEGGALLKKDLRALCRKNERVTLVVVGILRNMIVCV